MRSLLLWAAIVALVIIGHTPGRQRIADVTKPSTVVLRNGPFGTRLVYALGLEATGSIDGSATLQLVIDDHIIESKEISGQVSFTREGDWYSETAELRYIPKNVTHGSVVVKYAFADLTPNWLGFLTAGAGLFALFGGLMQWKFFNHPDQIPVRTMGRKATRLLCVVAGSGVMMLGLLMAIRFV